MLILLTVWLATFQAADDPEGRVRDFVVAFNARQADRMMTLVTDGVQWISVDGAKLSVETEGKAALRASMERMFSSCATCQSELVWVRRAGSRVTALERASYTGKSGPRSQTSLSVYEFADGRIARVYYFPSEQDPPAR